MRVSYIGNTPAFQAGKVGSIPTTRSIYALLAQLVEHLTLNQGVPGSNPWWRTKKEVTFVTSFFINLNWILFTVDSDISTC